MRLPSPMTRWTLLIAAAVTVPALLPAQDNEPSGNDNQASGEKIADPIGYFLGVSVGQSFTRQGFTPDDFDQSSFLQGMTDVLAEKPIALSDEELAETQGKVQAIVQRSQAKQAEQEKAAAQTNAKRSKAWLAKNADAKGVTQLENGLQYRVLKEGSGRSPKPEDTVKVHYTGKLIDGTVFDSSVERGEPTKFQVNRVIQGWQMALQRMKVGGKWQLYIPPELGYGTRGAPPKIGPNEVLVFEVELLEIL